jgi:hypothetical protein
VGASGDNWGPMSAVHQYAFIGNTLFLFFDKGKKNKNSKEISGKTGTEQWTN